MGYNKFIRTDGTMLLDLTGDTVTENDLPKGVIAHNAFGDLIVGKASGGSGDCSGEHVIEVTELPTENIDESAVYLCDGSYHKYSAKQFTDLVVSVPDNGVVAPIYELFQADASFFNYIYVETKPTENILESGEAGFNIYYVEYENNVFIYGNFTGDGNDWLPAGTLIALLLGVELPFNGFVSDETLATEFGLYAIGGNGWENYTVAKGGITIKKNGKHDVSGKAYVSVDVPPPDGYIVPNGTINIAETGTHDVRTYASASVNVPTVLNAVWTAEELPEDAPNGSYIIVLGGE